MCQGGAHEHKLVQELSKAAFVSDHQRVRLTSMKVKHRVVYVLNDQHHAISAYGEGGMSS